MLGSINLAACVENGTLDENKLRETARMATRFVDLVIERNVFPIPQIAEATRRTRKIGLGLMGVHDALLMAGLAYDSAAGRAWCERIMQIVTETAVDESRKRAEKVGPFPAWQESIWKEFPVRNAAMTTIAPTGTISLLAGCSSGIEPIFSFAYTRKNTVGKTFIIVNPVFQERLKSTLSATGLASAELQKKCDEVLAHVHETGSVQDLHWLPREFRDLFKTALDIGWKDHILMQAAFQKHVHASISKTVNMPSSATKDDCSEALLMAWSLKLKGITIYRNRQQGGRGPLPQGGRPGTSTRPVTLPVAIRHGPEKIPSLSINRPRELSGRTYLCQSGCCLLYVTVNLHEGKPMEVFIRTVGKRGLRCKQQRPGPCNQHRPPERRSLPEVRQAVREGQLHILHQEPVIGRPFLCRCGGALHRAPAKNQSITTLRDWDIHEMGKNACPECNEPFDFGEGCNKGICKNCGWTGCS